MAYADDVRAVKDLYRYRVAAMIAAGVLLALDAVTDLPLSWPRAIAWTIAGAISIKEGRAVKRLGRDPDGCWLRAALFFVVAVVCIAWPL
ncbi:MAG TPA: hypothetical protein VIF62_00800 [Labilithrix sp.]|jgi:hypothetical protein